MATLQQISEALQEIDTKKELLRKAFEDLQNHSDTLSFFSLNWSEIDSHFSNIHSSLSSRFSTLQQREQSQLPSSQDPQSSISQELRNQENNATIRELRDMCSKMEAGKLWNWLNERKEKKTVIQVELNEALKFAPDSAKLVMDAIDGFSVTGPEFGDMKIKNRNCMLLLEALMAMEGVNISGDMRERARSLMVAWKGKRKKEEIVAFEALMFLQLLASFRLGEEFDKNELHGFVEVIVFDPQSNGKLKQVGKCCQVLGLVDKAPELVRRLAKRGKQLHAVKFIHELKLADKCRPVPLLKSYLNQARKGARKLQKKTNMRINSGAIDTKDACISHGEVLSKEFTALKTVHKFIKEYNLESEYPIEVIEKRMKMVELQMAKKKSAVPQPEQQQNQSSSDN